MNKLKNSFQQNTKEKCRKFLANLLELSSREPKPVEKNVRTLIQELIDANVEPEEFCDRLERLLNASPQPCLIGFLKVRVLLSQSTKSPCYAHIARFVYIEKFAAIETIAGNKGISDRRNQTATSPYCIYWYFNTQYSSKLNLETHFTFLIEYLDTIGCFCYVCRLKFVQLDRR